MNSGDGPALEPNSNKPRYTAKGVSSTTIPPYDGSYGTFMEWKKSVEYSFGKTGYNKLLFDKDLCTEFDDASYSMKCILSEALHGGSAAYIAEIEKDERNVAIFFDILINTYDEKVDRRIREFQQWMKLFNNSLNERDNCASFINDFSSYASLF